MVLITMCTRVSVFLLLTIFCIGVANGSKTWLRWQGKPGNKFEETKKKLNECNDAHEISYDQPCSQEKFEEEYKKYTAKGSGSGWEDLKSVLVVSCNAPSKCKGGKCVCEGKCPVKAKSTPVSCQILSDELLHEEVVVEIMNQMDSLDICLDNFRGREGDKCASEDDQTQMVSILKKHGIPEKTPSAELPLAVQIELAKLECSIMGDIGCIMGQCRSMCPKCALQPKPKDNTVTCTKEEEDSRRDFSNRWNGKPMKMSEMTRKRLTACQETHEIPYDQPCSQDKFETEYKKYKAKGKWSGWEDLKAVLVVSCNAPSSCKAGKCVCEGKCPVKPKTTPTSCKMMMAGYHHREMVKELDPYFKCLDSFRGRDGDKCADPDLYQDKFTLIDPIYKKYSIPDGTIGAELPLVVQIELANLECSILKNMECIMGKCRAFYPSCIHGARRKNSGVTCKKEEADYWRAKGKPVPPTPNKQ